MRRKYQLSQISPSRGAQNIAVQEKRREKREARSALREQVYARLCTINYCRNTEEILEISKFTINYCRNTEELQKPCDFSEISGQEIFHTHTHTNRPFGELGSLSRVESQLASQAVEKRVSPLSFLLGTLRLASGKKCYCFRPARS